MENIDSKYKKVFEIPILDEGPVEKFLHRCMRSGIVAKIANKTDDAFGLGNFVPLILLLYLIYRPNARKLVLGIVLLSSTLFPYIAYNILQRII